MALTHASLGVSRQFASTARLFSAQEFERLQQAHIGVVGLGGVGSWAAEALARSGIGGLTLVDMDHVAESNLNRQAQALHSTLGQAKSEALASRLRDIAPDCRMQVLDAFLTPENAAELISPVSSVWIDATDDLAAKRAMILVMQSRKCLRQLIVCGAAGGKTDPARIEAADLSQTLQDPLLSTLRYDLRKHHGFPRQGKMRIQTVFSRQPMARGEDCDPSARLACAGYGSLVTVTATMGMIAANLAIQAVLRS